MTTTIESCTFCGQQNRVPSDVRPGFVARCGRCKQPFPRLAAPDLDDLDDDDDDVDDDDL